MAGNTSKFNSFVHYFLFHFSFCHVLLVLQNRNLVGGVGQLKKYIDLFYI